MAPKTPTLSQNASEETDGAKGSISKRTKRSRAESSGDVSTQSNNSKKGKKKKAVDVSPKKSESSTKQIPQKNPPTMDVVVHRMRCLNFQPKSILAIKTTPLWTKHNLLALSRENGYVEVKSVDDKLRTIGFLAGYRKRPVTCLAWVRKGSDDDSSPLLLGASRDGSIFHVNLANQDFTNVTTSGGGAVLALESLSSVVGCERYVAAACEDGSVRIFQYNEAGSLLLISTIPSCGAPVLSLAWRKTNSSAGEKGLSGLVVFAAVADGTIRRFDCSLKKERFVWKSRNRITVESRGRNVPTRVWALKALKDGTLVSANSLGQVQFWDGETGSLEQSIEQTQTKADVLNLAVSADESRVFASGVDSRVVCIQRQLGAEPSVWMLTQAQRGHTHDVKGLEICRTKSVNTASIEILFSGGVDTKLCTYPVETFHNERPRVLYPWPTSPPFFAAANARMLAVMRERKVELFRLADKQTVLNPVSIGDKEAPVGTVEIRHASNLVCADLSTNGRWLAVANMESFYVFSLSFDKKERLQTKPVPIATDLGSPVSAVKFTNDNTLALSCVDGSVYVVSLPGAGTDDKHTVHKSKLKSSTKDFPIHRIVSSKSGSLIAAQSNTLKGGVVEVFSVDEDNYVSRLWTLPSLDTSISDITFVDENRLAVACVDFTLFVFDVKEQRLNQWNRDAGTRPMVPKDLKHRQDFPIRVLSHPESPDKVILVSFGMFAVFDLGKPFPTLCKHFPDKQARGEKGKRSTPVESTAFLCFQYDNILYLDFVDGGEMVVVEQSWTDILATLPAALARRVYGT